MGEDGASVVHSVGFGEVSDLGVFAVDAGKLEFRVAGSEAAILDLAAGQLEGGASNTLFLIGTPVEELPLEVVAAPNPVASTAAVTPAAPPFAPVEATDRTWLRDSINELEARLEAIEQRLDNLADLDGAKEDVDAALQELEEAMALLADARDRMAALPVPTPDPPPATEPEPALP